MNLDGIYRAGAAKAWSEDFAAQKYYTDVIAKARGMSSNPFRKINSIFVPNDEYMIRYFGKEISNEMYGCYDAQGVCYWNNCLLLPVLNVADKVAGFVSFNPFKYAEAKETHDWSIYYYAYSSKDIFNKGCYLFMCEGIYKKAMQDGYLIVVDGTFDAVNLACAGFNAGALLGSTLTPQLVMLLRFIKKIVFLADNDDAGLLLYENLKRQHPNVALFKQGVGKDADDVLKSEFRDSYVKQLKDFVHRDSAMALASF